MDRIGNGTPFRYGAFEAAQTRRPSNPISEISPPRISQGQRIAEPAVPLTNKLPLLLNGYTARERGCAWVDYLSGSMAASIVEARGKRLHAEVAHVAQGHRRAELPTVRCGTNANAARSHVVEKSAFLRNKHA